MIPSVQIEGCSEKIQLLLLGTDQVDVWREYADASIVFHWIVRVKCLHVHDDSATLHDSEQGCCMKVFDWEKRTTMEERDIGHLI